MCRVKCIFSLLAALLFVPGCGAKGSDGSTSAPQGTVLVQTQPSAPATQLNWSLVQSFPHDTNAFTQGLVWHQGQLFESTGLVGKTSVRRVEVSTGRVLQKRDFAPPLFGEGLAVARDKLYFFTWQNRQGFILNPADLTIEGRFNYANEGWGLTYDGTHLIQSDGTDTLTWRDPADFRAVNQIKVTWNGVPQPDLNELEWVEGSLWANIWKTDNIVVIDPATGKVTAFLDLTALRPATERARTEDVLNGIAYDASTQRVFVTGKNWPRLYGLKVAGLKAPDPVRRAH